MPAPADLGLDVVKADIGGKGKAVHDQFWVVGADGKKLAADELPAVQQVGEGARCRGGPVWVGHYCLGRGAAGPVRWRGAGEQGRGVSRKGVVGQWR